MSFVLAQVKTFGAFHAAIEVYGAEWLEMPSWESNQIDLSFRG